MSDLCALFRAGLISGVFAAQVSCVSPEWVLNQVPASEDISVVEEMASEDLAGAEAGYVPPDKEMTPDHQESETQTVDRFAFSPEDIDARLAESWFSHRVRRGESLGIIARKYGTSVPALRRANKIRGTRIYAGQALVIPTVSRNRSKSSYPDLADMWDQELAQLLARESFHYGTTKKTLGKCLRGVRIALTRSLQKAGIVEENQRLFMGQSAHQFKTWAVNNPGELCRKYKLVPIVGNEERPLYPGLIYVYGKGRCGFSKRYGHVETVVSTDPGMVCSDSCRSISSKSCKPDLILAPCKSCPDRNGNFVAVSAK